MWTPETYEIAYPGGPVAVAGYTYRGLGLDMASRASPKRKRPPLWRLSHLGTGHRIATLLGKVAVAFPVATEIAECGDWDFLSLEGWKDRFPDARDRLTEVCERHPKVVRDFANGETQIGAGREVAQQIAANRP